jgi:hypothetical protein
VLSAEWALAASNKKVPSVEPEVCLLLLVAHVHALLHKAS